MNRLLQELKVLIEKKIGLYDRFIRLLEEQWTCITEYSLESLQSIMEKKEDLVDQMQSLEKERSRVMLKIEEKLCVTRPGLTLKNLIQMTQDPIGDTLAKRRETLLGQIAVINDLHERLKGLMDHSSLSMKRSMAFVHSTVEAASSPYHANGKLPDAKPQGKMLSLDA